MKIWSFLTLVAVIFITACNGVSQPLAPPTSARAFIPISPQDRINGLTFVAPPEPFPQNPMPVVQQAGANWIAAIPYGFTRPDEETPTVHYNEHRFQWWGESAEGVGETIRLAHEAGLKVMLKPQVWMHGGWTGSLDFPSDQKWESWEKGYTTYILFFARLAAEKQADMFCIGTEFNNAIHKRPDFWRSLIRQIRQVYSGKLTYSSNWDDWDQVPFWPDLDYIGLGGYFPLVNDPTPSVASLQAAWKPIVTRLGDFSKSRQKPILFTEFGYLSVDSCGGRNWELEHGIEQRRINQQAQANCLEALFSTLQPEPWWAGGFLWKWFPNMRGHEGYPERDYTPQGKLGESVLKKYYKQ